MIGGDADDLGSTPDFGASIDRARHETIHDAFGVDKTVGGAEASSDNVVRPKLRHNLANVAGGNQPDIFHAQARLQRATNLVDLYRELGGGWIEHAGDQPRPADAPADFGPVASGTAAVSTASANDAGSAKLVPVEHLIVEKPAS